MPAANRPRVSVITPSLNQGAFIGRTLASVRAQTFSSKEHFIVDGGSSDSTLSELSAQGPSVNWVSEPDRGQAHAVNKGIARTTGDIVAWINSDDVYYPGALGEVVRFFDEHPDVDVLFGDADHIDATDTVLERYPTEPFDASRLLTTCYLCQPATFFRRHCVARYGPLDERLHYCMDYEYWLRLTRGGAKFAYLPVRLAGSRLHLDAKTIRARVPVHAEINDMFLRVLGKVPDTWLENYAHVRSEERIDRRVRPLKFSVAVNYQTILAALRWNRSISSAMRRKLLGRLRKFVLGEREVRSA